MNSIDPIGILDGVASVDDRPTQADQEQEEIDTVGRVKKLFEAAQANQTQRILNENLYLASIMGDQYLAIDPVTGVVYRVLDNSQSQYVSQNNQMIGLHLSLWGKLIKPDTGFTVTPGSGSLDEMQGAKAAERFIEYYRTARNSKEIIEAAKSCVSWSTKGGLVELMWDPQGGSDFYHCFTCGYSTEVDLDDQEQVPCPNCEQQQQQFEMQMQQYQMEMQHPQQFDNTQPQQQTAPAGSPGQPPLQGAPPQQQPIPQPPQQPPPPGMLESLNRGGPCMSWLDPRNVYFQPGCEKWDNVQWYIVREALPINVVRDMFPHKALQIYPESDVYPNHGAQWAVNYEENNYVNEQLQDHVYLYRCVEKPTALNRQGSITFVANNMLLARVPGYFRDFGRLPLFRFGWIPVPGTPYYRPPAADAWHRQREENRLETQMSEYASLIARTKIIIPYGSRIAMDEVTAQSAQVLMPTLATANMVKYLNPPPMPQDIYSRRELLINDMRMMFAVTVQEQAAAPQDPNGRYAAIAEAESDQTTGPILKAHDREEADLYRCMLILVQVCGDPEEKFFGLGKNNQEIYSFQDLMFRAKHSNVGVIPSDGMASNSAIRQQQANTQMQLGLFGNPMDGTLDKSQYAEAAGLKLPGLVPSMSDTEVQAANAAIKLLEDGQPYQPKPYDNAQIFSQVVLDWLQSNGRMQEQHNPQWVQQVTDLYMYYQQQLFMQEQASAVQASPGGATPAIGGGQSNSGNDSSAPGGTPNSAVPPSGPNSEAKQITHNADKQGESAVKASMSHEN